MSDQEERARSSGGFRQFRCSSSLGSALLLEELLQRSHFVGGKSDRTSSDFARRSSKSHVQRQVWNFSKKRKKEEIILYVVTQLSINLSSV